MLDFLDWESPISLEKVFSSGDSFSYPHIVQDGSGDLLYLSSIKQQKSRLALMLLAGDEHHCLTPQPFSLRTRVNEYGGKPFWVFGADVLFCNDSDQCLYKVSVSDKGATPPQRVTIKSSTRPRYMYTDVNRVGAVYLAIVEQEAESDEADEELSQNTMFLACIDGSDKAPVPLQVGADFYSNLVVSHDQQRIAWVQWNHPNMPWDETELWVANLAHDAGGVRLVDAQRVELAPTACVCQLLFASDGRLFFSADFALDTWRNNFWNIYALEPRSNQVSRVSQEAFEFGYPHWQYGDQRIVQFDADTLIAVGSTPESDVLFSIGLRDLSVKPVAWEAATIQYLASDGQGKMTALQLGQASSPQVVTFEIQNREVIRQSYVSNSEPEIECSIPEHLSFKTRDGGVAYGFYYAPCNSEYAAKTNSIAKPPLIVMVHGGPTARAYGHFDIQKQFWTSRGFAVFDVNHRGSSGYGRNFRDALYGHWGDLDISDIIDGVNMLVAQNKVDGKRLCIRGKSAGGYAVLRALTEYPGFFKAGACYYGIGNLETLAAQTHKFEKYYTDRLVGEAYATRPKTVSESRYYQRSPIHQLPSLESAMIVFQGSLDKIVPPTVAQEIINVLDRVGLWHEYVEYADEAHGFRQVANNIDALGRELMFYQNVLRESGARREIQ
ncbi:alpha/beta hydrolase family protein [Arenicella xantha]|uniref:Dipeptidyl aminopeptidase/acylaminoacyl peptidase n=1 Tax=Arenicella xantha TaxID=644221 RepID=A0A395JH92_9GAMM|nr:prolyl oligopeptidase family serine peptidase [Arenicella xantha]RBP49205.1 dipeptidyl aminopeptidase/acylaminoacyl peptidase [Arenicella xantha]